MEALFLGLWFTVISGVLASNIASAKGWSGLNWFLAGFLFGPFGLVAAAGLPDRRLRVYLRHLASEQGWKDGKENQVELAEPGAGDADEQRKRILGR